MSEPTKPSDPPALSREESAFFIKTIWEGLLAPDWTRDHLIELGKVVFTKIPLAKLTDQQFGMLLPYLQKMANTVGARILQQPSAAKQPTDEKTEKTND